MLMSSVLFSFWSFPREPTRPLLSWIVNNSSNYRRNVLDGFVVNGSLSALKLSHCWRTYSRTSNAFLKSENITDPSSFVPWPIDAKGSKLCSFRRGKLNSIIRMPRQTAIPTYVWAMESRSCTWHPVHPFPFVSQFFLQSSQFLLFLLLSGTDPLPTSP